MKFQNARTIKKLITPHISSTHISRHGTQRISVVWQKGQAWTLKLRVSSRLALVFAMLTFTLLAHADDPRTNSWLTTYAGQYARIYTNNAMMNSGTTLLTWSKGSLSQTLPAYCGVQEVYSSSNWVYIRTTGLAPHTMGPWQNGAFPNLPVNTKTLWRIPRTPFVQGTNFTGLGAIGYFVDGVAMFDSRDAFYWNGSTETQGNGYWNRDAYVNESATFDSGYAHQENTGTHHYHANPPALRYQLGDHVDYFSSSNTYAEATNAVTKHSPILGWMADGYPLYGPYGYSVATDSNSAVRRMISGYVLRNGQYNTDNLTNTLRANLPAWAQRLYGTNSAGPTDINTYPIGRYLEDKAYLGDLGYTQGTDFDLDEHNGRWCVTPEFPNGTYAYFVSISSNGVPTFPYNIGRTFYGYPASGSVSAISETVVTNFLGNTNLSSTLSTPNMNNGTVTLTWSAIEGGKYQVESSPDLSSWNVLATNVAPNQITGAYTNATSTDVNFYRTARTSVSNFDNSGAVVFATPVAVPGGSATRGTTVLMTITLPSNPPQPPSDKIPASVAISGVITNTTGLSRPTAGTVQAIITIPSGAPLTTNVVVTFSPAPTYTLTNGITLN